MSNSTHGSAVVMGFKAFLSLLSILWISADVDIQILAALLSMDVLTSIFNPAKRLRFVLTRSALTAILVLTVHWVYHKASQVAGLNVGIDLSTAVCSFYILGTAIQILDNCRPWISIPPALDAVLMKAEGLRKKDADK